MITSHVDFRWLACAVLVLAVPAAADEQSPGAAETSLDTALAQNLTSSPIPGQTGVAISAAGTLQTGRTDTKGWSVDAIVAHTTTAGLLMRVDAEISRTDYRLPDGPVVEIENQHLASLLIMRPLNRGVSMIGTLGWQHDHALLLDYRAWIESGVGFHLAEHARLNVLIAPMFSVGRERRSFTDAGQRVLDVSMLHTVSYRPHAAFTLDTFVSVRLDTSHARDKNVAVNVSALSKVARYLSLKVYYQHQHAQLVPPGQDPRQSMLGVALQVNVQKTPATAPK